MDATPDNPFRPLKIAVVGSGISGMSAAWLLSKRHKVTVFEKETRVGGHSNTVMASVGDVGQTPVDTGFIVYNELNYPNLTALFDHLNVTTVDSNMSFAASIGAGALEYAGDNLNTLFGQRRNILRPRFWLMLKDLVRFYKSAPTALDDPSTVDMSLGTYLLKHDYSNAFVEDHLLPMGAAIWSTTAEDMRAYPIRAFVRFFVSHGLLNLTDRPQWRTVKGGSRRYVEALTADYAADIVHDGVTRISRGAEGVSITTATGRHEAFDDVVIASHADEALGLLEDADDLERALLGRWRYTENRAYLHTDATLMPKNKRVWSSWNFIEGDQDDQLCVTYWMNRLQPLESKTDLFVTLNPVHEPDPAKVLRTFDYTHPYFDVSALESQPELWRLQGRRNTWFCGSYFGYGFHEDGLQSGLAVAEQLGGLRRPWSVEGESNRIHVSHIATRNQAVAPVMTAAE